MLDMEHFERPLKVFGMNRGTVGFLMNEYLQKIWSRHLCCTAVCASSAHVRPWMARLREPWRSMKFLPGKSPDGKDQDHHRWYCRAGRVGLRRACCCPGKHCRLWSFRTRPHRAARRGVLALTPISAFAPALAWWAA